MNDMEDTTAPAGPARARLISIEDRVHDTKMFAQVAQVLIDDMLGICIKDAQGMIRLTPWETDVLIFAVHQAKVSAEALHEAYTAVEYPSLDGRAS